MRSAILLKRARYYLLGMGLLLLVQACPCLGEDGDAASHDGETIILNSYSYWRCHVTLRPLLFGTRTDAKPDDAGRIAPSFSYRLKKLNREPYVLPADGPKTELPPSDWMHPDFDDSRWWQDPGPFYGGGTHVYGHRHQPHGLRDGQEQPVNLALLCARGKFTVVEPERVKSLKLSLEFRAGLVVYLNGKEVARKFMPPGEIEFETLAEDYPRECFLDPDPDSKSSYPGSPRPRGELLELRVRKAEDLELPIALLHRGTNVLALEIHRAAMHPDILDVRRRDNLTWNSVGLLAVSLKTAGGGIRSNTGRPEGIQVWNASVLESIYECEYGEPHEPLKPIRIEGTRNGIFSGQVLVSSRQPIKGLRASVTELKHRDGKGSISASLIEMRYPRPTRREHAPPKLVYDTRGRYGTRGPPSLRFDALYEEPLAEVPVQEISERYLEERSSLPWRGAVQPVWLKVHIPADAPTGQYDGRLTITLDGSPSITVPVELNVQAFCLPNPVDYQTWVDFVHSPGHLALYYEVPAWSKKHWQYIDRSLKLLAEVGNKNLYIPIICRSALFNGNETMVRWIREPEGLRCELSLVERFLDLALERGLKPRAICLQVWDYHIGREPNWKIGTGGYGQLTINEQQPVPVALLDPETGRVEEMTGPRYSDAQAEDFWKPVAEGLREIISKRGLEDAMMLGMAGDYVPSKETVQLWNRLLPGAAWATMAHGGTDALYGVPVGYSARVLFGCYPIDPAVHRNYGWQLPQVITFFSRYGHAGADFFQVAGDRLAFEFGLCMGMRGAGWLNLDVFSMRRDRISAPHRGSVGLPSHWLAPGPAGPLSTVSFEMGREGIQECEARIYIEQALTDDARKAELGEALATRAQAILDERTRRVCWAQEKNFNNAPYTYLPGGPLGLDWYAGADWETQAAELFRVAGEIADRLSEP